MSFEFHPDTFKQLFHIIKQLTGDLNVNLMYILIVCLRLFTTHLKYLFLITNNSFELTDDELQTWFDTLLILACHENTKPEEFIISKEASKALIEILNKKVSSFSEKLSFIHKHIIENKHFVLIKELLIELNTNTTLLNWIDILSDNKPEDMEAVNILYSFIDFHFNPSNEIKLKIKQHIQQILQRFQQFIFMRLSTTTACSSE